MPADDARVDREAVDPRYRLASERTFLAWSRTSLALVAAGVAAIELMARQASGVPAALLGAPLIAMGAVIAVLSHSRLRGVDQALERGDDLPPTALPKLLVATIVTAAIAAIAITAFR